MSDTPWTECKCCYHVHHKSTPCTCVKFKVKHDTSDNGDGSRFARTEEVWVKGDAHFAAGEWAKNTDRDDTFWNSIPGHGSECEYLTLQLTDVHGAITEHRVTRVDQPQYSVVSA